MRVDISCRKSASFFKKEPTTANRQPRVNSIQSSRCTLSKCSFSKNSQETDCSRPRQRRAAAAEAAAAAAPATIANCESLSMRANSGLIYRCTTHSSMGQFHDQQSRFTKNFHEHRPDNCKFVDLPDEPQLLSCIVKKRSHCNAKIRDHQELKQTERRLVTIPARPSRRNNQNFRQQATTATRNPIVLFSLSLLFLPLLLALLHSLLIIQDNPNETSLLFSVSAQSYDAAVNQGEFPLHTSNAPSHRNQEHHQAASSAATAASQAESSPALATSASSSTASNAAACFGGLQTFEKISMSSFENPAGSSGSSSSSSGASSANGNSFNSGILIQQDDQALTSECINLCRSQSNCLSFVIDYNKFECKSYATTQQELQQEFAVKFQAARAATTNLNNTQDTLDSTSSSSSSSGGFQASSSNFNLQQLLPSASSNYFEKICLDGVANRNQFSDVCGPGRLWTIERVVDSFLDGFIEKEVTNVNNKDECSKLCIFETQFVCRSADYDQASRLCRLSKEDRRTQPQAMRYVANSQRQYLENQCATPGPSSCVYETKRNIAIISMDALKFAQTVQDCQMKCNQELTFNCRSYSFHQQRCFLSGDDGASLNSNLIKLPQKQGWTFGEKKCLVELCTKGIFSYEKISGYALRSALSTAIDLMVPGSSSSSARSTGELLQTDASSSNQLRQRNLPRAPPAYSTYPSNGSSANSLASAMMMMMMTTAGEASLDHHRSSHQTSSEQRGLDPLHESGSVRNLRSTSSNNLAITEHCRHSCDLGYLNCPAFTIDYKNNRCQRLDRNSQGRHNELVARDGFAYYEKICLRVPEIMSMCQDKYWIFERVPGYELAPRLYEKSLKFVQSRRDCEEYCLEEKQFQCRSALYNDETSDCKLSRVNRRLALQEGGYNRNFNARISYLENNCVRDHQLERESCFYEQTKDEPAYPTFTERIEMATAHNQQADSALNSMRLHASGHSSNENNSTSAAAAAAAAAQRFGSSFCEQLCNDNSKFECHSFGYYASTAQCFLSGDDSVSAGDLATTPSTGFRYYEKKCRLTPARGTNGSEINESEGSPGAPPKYGDQGQQPQRPGQNLNPYFVQPSRGASRPSATPTPNGHDFQQDAGPADTRPPTPFVLNNFSTPNEQTIGGSGSRVPPSHHKPTILTFDNSNSNSNNGSGGDSDAYKCGAGHSFVYQRISGFEPIGGYLTLLAKNNEQPGIVAECAGLCRRAYECRAFVVDYTSNQCYAMLENSSVGLLSLRQILGKDYFEGFCISDHLLTTQASNINGNLNGSPLSTSCANKTWAIDKIVDQSVVGVQHAKLITNSDRAQCRLACLEERLFTCKSAMYDSSSGECKLYSIDRESVPQMRLLFTKGVDFFENQCQISSNACPYDALERDMTITTITKSIQARSTFDCELACNSELGFNCRSYTYMDQYPSLPNLCLLSSDSRSTSQRGSVKEFPKTLYAERNCYYRRPRFPGGGSFSSSHKYDHGAFSPSAGGDTQLRPPINPLLGDPYASPGGGGGSSINAMQPERVSTSSGDSAGPATTEQQEGANGLFAHEFVGPALGAGTCEPHQYTFERTFGYDFKLAPKERAPIAPTIGIAIGCQQECLRRGERCQSFVVDYALPYQSCFLMESQVGANKRMLSRAPNSAYFEKVCLPRTGLVVGELPLSTAASAPTNTLANDQTSASNALLDAPLRMMQRNQQQQQQQLALMSASGSSNPMVELLDPAQSLDISPSYSSEPWSLRPAPPPQASQLPYYLQQQQLVQNYPSRTCAKLWTFERFVNYNFTAPVDKLIEKSLSRAHCETQCLNEAVFTCRAATYDYSNKICRLFKSTRRTIMSQFVDLDAPGELSQTEQLQPTASGTLANSHPGTAHVLDMAAGTDAIQTAASSFVQPVSVNDVVQQQQQQKQRRQMNARQLLTGASSLSQTSATLLTAEPLNSSKNIDYLENTCTVEPSSCQYRQIYDQFSPYIDKVNHAISLSDCQRQCDQERLFSCKSVNYDPTSKSCMLLNEDLISLNRNGGGGGGQQTVSTLAVVGSHLLPKKNTIYSEKGNCEMISVQCNSQEMLVSVNFDSPFRGRLMAKGNPEQCYILGDGQTNLQFSIVFGPKCNSRQEGHNTFVNEIVIQQHPVIMTESDKTVRVMCAFEAPDQTITLKNPSARDNRTAGIDVGAPDSGRTRHDKQQFNSVVSNKAAPPSVMLRILDQNGRDASMINLGDDLQLKIQMSLDQSGGGRNSALGIFARNLAARSSNGESLLLIDNEGCPVDAQVFPALEVDQKDGKSLYSTFKAFRFPSSGLVNFEVQIRFCPERCQPVDCGEKLNAHKVRSHGRRKKRQTDVKQEEEQQERELAEEREQLSKKDDSPAGRATFLQSVSRGETASSQLVGASSPVPSLDSLSTVMKPGKAFEYVRKLMLPEQEQSEQNFQSPAGEVRVKGEGAEEATPDKETPGLQQTQLPAIHTDSSNNSNSNSNEQLTNIQPTMTNSNSDEQKGAEQANEDFDSYSLQATTEIAPPSDQMTVSRPPVESDNRAIGEQFSPPDYSRMAISLTEGQTLNVGDQFVASQMGVLRPTTPAAISTGQKSILMHVDERIVPAPAPQQPSAFIKQTPEAAASAPNFNHFGPVPYDSSAILQSSQSGQISAPASQAVATKPNGGEIDEENGVTASSTLGDSLGAATPSSEFDQQQEAKVAQNGQFQSELTNANNNNNRDLPLRFSILVGENQVPSHVGFSAGASQPPLIMNSTSLDLDHIVIPGKKGQFEEPEVEQQLGINSISSLQQASPSLTATAPTQTTTTTASTNFDGGETANNLDFVNGRDVRTRDTNKRNASYEQTFDALPSNSISSEILVNHQANIAHNLPSPEQRDVTNLNELTHTVNKRPQHATGAIESAASHDCHLESNKSRLRTIIWTGGIVISLNVCLVILSLVLYFRKVHARQNHSIVRSTSSDCGTASRSSRLTGGGSGGVGGSRHWPSVILKSKNKLGTSLNAHEHFFCMLNSKPERVAGTSGFANAEQAYNWPNHSTSSSRSTVSSLASPLPANPTNVRINQMSRPSLRSIPFDAHSTLRSGHFNPGRHEESNHEKNEYTARYTNNIDVLHSEQF